MKEFKGTKGKWIKSKKSIGFVFALKLDDNMEVNAFSLNINNDGMLPDSEIEANAKLIASAPEMFEMLKQAKTTICRLRLSISIHPDCEENSEFADYVDLADEKEKQIKQLLTKITE